MFLSVGDKLGWVFYCGVRTWTSATTAGSTEILTVGLSESNVSSLSTIVPVAVFVVITKDSVPAVVVVVALEIVAITDSLPSYVLSTIVVTVKSTGLSCWNSYRC